MARTSRWSHAVAAFLLLLAPLSANAQLSNLPDLSTATDSTATSGGTSAQSTGQTTTGGTSAQSTITGTSGQTTGTNDATTTGTFALTGAPSLTSNSAFHLTGLPTIAGAGIPTLVIPYTANAPFMQKSSLPEGTFFIVVGATLAFIGACVVLWRLMVAWSVNRSVKRTAMASVRGTSEKRGSSYGWSSNSGYGPVSNNHNYPYKDTKASVSLDNLTSAGKPVKPHFRDSVIERGTTPPTNLFFSPTAQAQNRDSTISANTQRNSGYMPSGYYASPSSHAANGQANTTIGGSLAPYANQNRQSTYSQPSPPPSPGLNPQSRGSNQQYRQSRDSTAAYRQSVQSRESMLRANSPHGLRAQSRDGLGSNRNSYMYGNPSSSSLMVGGASTSDVSRAPSAYLDDLFENHGHGPRERF